MSKEKKGEIEMNAYATKPNGAFITSKTLGRTPASETTKKIVQFLDSHNFSFSVNKNTNDFKCTVTDK